MTSYIWGETTKVTYACCSVKFRSKVNHISVSRMKQLVNLSVTSWGGGVRVNNVIQLFMGKTSIIFYGFFSLSDVAKHFNYMLNELFKGYNIVQTNKDIYERKLQNWHCFGLHGLHIYKMVDLI